MNTRVTTFAGLLVLATATGCSDKTGSFPGDPVFVSVPQERARVGIPYEPTALALDPDGQEVTYEVVSGPAGLTIDETTGQLAWIPAGDQQGSNIVHLRATDRGKQSGDLVYDVRVGLNAPPVIHGAPLTGACIGDAIDSHVYVTDADADPVTIEAINPPAGFTLDPDTGALQYTPTGADAGEITVEIRATDVYGAESRMLLSLDVDGFPTDPAKNMAIANRLESEEYSVIAQGTDFATWVLTADFAYDGSGGFWLRRLEPANGCRAVGARRIGPITPGFEPYWMAIAAAPDGGVYVAFSEYYYGGGNESGFSYLQRYDVAGDPVWAMPVRLTTLTLNVEEYVTAVAADATGAVVTFYDDFAGGLRAQKLAPDGSKVWGDDGVAIPFAYSDVSPSTLLMDGGNAVMFWGYGNTVRGQRLAAATGALVWASNGAIVATRNLYDVQGAAADGNGNYYVSFYGYSPYFQAVQKVDANGAPLWAANGVDAGITSWSQSMNYYDSNLGVHSGGDVFVSWANRYDDVYVARLAAADGANVWTSSVGSYGYDSYGTTLEMVGDEPVVAWTGSGGNYRNIFAQRFNESGSTLWGNGTIVTSAVYDQDYPAIVAGEQGKLVLAWEDYRSDYDEDSYMQSLRPDGTLGN